MPQSLENAPSLAQALMVNLVVSRAQKGLSQQELADAAGVSRVLISQIERGLANFTVDTLERLSTALEVDPRELLEPVDYSVASDDEIARRLASGEWVGARALLAAIDENKSFHKRPVASRDASKRSKGRRRVRRR